MSLIIEVPQPTESIHMSFQQLITMLNDVLTFKCGEDLIGKIQQMALIMRQPAKILNPNDPTPKGEPSLLLSINWKTPHNIEIVKSGGN